MDIRKRRSAAILLPALALLAVCAFTLTAARADAPPSAYTAYLPAIAKDVAHPVGHFGGAATALALEGTTLYAGVGPALQVFDVAAPMQLTLLGAAPLADIAADILVHDGYAYVALRYAGLQVVDITTPAAPRAVARLDLGDRAQALAVKGSALYVAGEKVGLHVVDIATPAAPRRVDTLSSFQGLDDLAVVGSHLYVAPYFRDDHQEIGILDISLPLQPVYSGGFQGGWDQLAAADPNLLVVAGSGPLKLLDVTTPLAPRIVGDCQDYACEYADAIYASGHRLAVVARSQADLSLYDISDPAHPTLLGSYSQRDASVADVALGSASVYAAGAVGLDDAQGILALKVAQGELLAGGDFPDNVLASPFGGYAYKFQADAAHLYLLAPTSVFSSTLRVFDTTTPAAPREIAARTVPAAHPHALARDGARLYLALDELRVVDITDPAAPVVGGAFRGQHITQDVTVVNHLAAVLDSDGIGDDVVRFVDASDPAAPHAVGSYAPQGRVSALVGVGATLYLAVKPAFSGAVLQIVDVATPASPRVLGSYAVSGKVLALDVSGGRAYVFATLYNDDHAGNLLILDVTDPAAVRQLGARPENDVTHIQAVGNTVYLNPRADEPFYNGRWLTALDVTTPAAPRLVGFLSAETLDTFQVVGAAAYADMGKLRTLDISIPGAPQVFGFVTTPAALDVVVQGTLAYTAAGDNGLQALDVSTPLRPRWQSATRTVDAASWLSPGAGRVLCVGGAYYRSLYEMLPAGRLALRDYSGGTDPEGMALCDGTRLYLADDFDDILIYDIADPDDPRWLGAVELERGNEPFAVQGNRLYVSARSTFRIYDVTDPAHAQRLAEITLDQGYGELDVVGAYAYIADYDVGLRIIDVSDPHAPREVASLPLPGAWPIRVSGGYAYIGTRPVWQATGQSYTSAGLAVVDVSNPLAPRLMSQYAAPGSLDAIEVAGGYVYAAAGSGGLYVFKAQ